MTQSIRPHEQPVGRQMRQNDPVDVDEDLPAEVEGQVLQEGPGALVG
jgi:hypothetical protein